MESWNFSTHFIIEIQNAIAKPIFHKNGIINSQDTWNWHWFPKTIHIYSDDIKQVIFLIRFKLAITILLVLKSSNDFKKYKSFAVFQISSISKEDLKYLWTYERSFLWRINKSIFMKNHFPCVENQKFHIISMVVIYFSCPLLSVKNGSLWHIISGLRNALHILTALLHCTGLCKADFVCLNHPSILATFVIPSGHMNKQKF